MTINRQGMSEREYAAHAGVSRGAVQKARASGRLLLHADGSIDAAASDARRLDATDPAKRRQPLPGYKPVPEAAVGAVTETLREQGLLAPTMAGGMTYLQAHTANETLKAHERRLRLQKLKGEVVDRARAVGLVFRLARQERDAWAGWPARVAAMMAADLGIGAHAMQTALETYVRQHLGELAEIRPDLR
ncbi:MAG: elements of external origin [Rhodospirillales bacterium]